MKTGNTIKRTLGVVLTMVAFVQPLFADALTDIAKDIGDVMKIILGMACLIELGVVIASIIKGDRDQVDKGAKWIIITATIFFVISAVQGTI